MTSDNRRIASLRRAVSRGVTLIEILIVLAIVGLIAGGVAIVAIPKFQQAQLDTAKNNAIEIHRIAEAWRAMNSTECPTVERLRAEKEIAATAKITDPWDNPYKILCEEDELQVVSFGPDKKENTKDDIRIPAEISGGEE